MVDCFRRIAWLSLLTVLVPVGPSQAQAADDRAAAKFFIVDGIHPGDELNVRASASPVAMVIGRLPNGAQLRNFGCDTIKGALWCKIADISNPSLSGWSPGRYLQPTELSEEEAAAAAAAPASSPTPPADGGDAAAPAAATVAPVPGIPCARHFGQPMTVCAINVSRGAKGEATVVITWPDGGDRLIRFREGRPDASDASADLTFTREDKLNLIRIGKDERFEILDSMAFGG